LISFASKNENRIELTNLSCFLIEFKMPKSDQHVDDQQYSVIPRVLVFVFKDDEILLIKGAGNKRIWAGKYNGIGGHVEQGESVLEAARRELKEEAGITKCDLWLSGIVSVDVEKSKGVCLFVYKGIYSDGKIQVSKEGELKWVNINSISSLPFVEDLPVLLSRVIKHEKNAPVLFAQSFYNEQKRLITEFNS
jgi:8-oxo-dGTP diphosphatase